ncbi:MAG: hypothetical protein ABI867_05955, partial [Kofleriaceae bacterium]
MRLTTSAVFALLVACGGDKAPADVDAAPPPIDAAPDAGELPPGCDYAEQRDLTNDDVPPATGVPEQTGLVFTTRS